MKSGIRRGSAVLALAALPFFAACSSDDSSDTENTDTNQSAPAEGGEETSDGEGGRSGEPATGGATDGATDGATEGAGGDAAADDDVQAAAQTAEKYFHALGDGDPEAACKLMSGPGNASGMGDDPTMLQACTEGARSQVEAFTDEQKKVFKEVKVVNATVTGDKAVVAPSDLEGGARPGSENTIPLVKINDQWYLDSEQLVAQGGDGATTAPGDGESTAPEDDETSGD